MKLTEALERFLKAKRRREATKEAYRWSLGRHFAFLGADRDVRDITVDDLDAWASDLWACDLSEWTIAKRMREVRAFWRWLARRRHIAESPFDLEIPNPKIAPLRNRSIDPEDRDAMLAAAKRHSARDYAILRFLTDVGCRAGGVCRLRLCFLNLEDHSATLDEKGGNEFFGYYTERTANALRAWLKKRPNVDHDYVFVSERGRPLDRRSLYAILRRTAARAGVTRRFNTHAWRHDVGRRFFSAGIAPTIVQAKLGHSSPFVTMLYYGNQDDQALRDATDRLSPA